MRKALLPGGDLTPPPRRGGAPTPPGAVGRNYNLFHMRATPLLEGKVALVTGGAAGIGRGIAEAFAAEGASVVVADIDVDAATSVVGSIDASGGQATAHVADVTDADEVRALAEAAGPVDVLVNNVGHYLFRAHDFVESTEEEWDELYRVNLLHVLLCCRHVLPGMIERGRGGSVINVSTVEAFRAIP